MQNEETQPTTNKGLRNGKPYQDVVDPKSLVKRRDTKEKKNSPKVDTSNPTQTSSGSNAVFNPNLREVLNTSNRSVITTTQIAELNNYSHLASPLQTAEQFSIQQHADLRAQTSSDTVNTELPKEQQASQGESSTPFTQRDSLNPDRTWRGFEEQWNSYFNQAFYQKEAQIITEETESESSSANASFTMPITPEEISEMVKAQVAAEVQEVIKTYEAKQQQANAHAEKLQQSNDILIRQLGKTSPTRTLTTAISGLRLGVPNALTTEKPVFKQGRTPPKEFLRDVEGREIPSAFDREMTDLTNKPKEQVLAELKSLPTELRRHIEWVKNNIRKRQAENKTQYDKRHITHPFKSGDKVMILNHSRSDKAAHKIQKLLRRWIGPFLLGSQAEDNNVTFEILTIPDFRRVGSRHVSDLKPYVERRTVRRRLVASPNVEDIDNTDEPTEDQEQQPGRPTRRTRERLDYKTLAGYKTKNRAKKNS
ncbi:unnamed protein product [Orchesella dallaii]|uniref:Uncharacterized protein n=1 Tax=Orchesella dallaii TaxID=48710 RepID=A0ABP1S7H5_9HEXA